MKKAKRKSTFWLMGGLAALTFLSSGSMATAQVITSYNDLAWDVGQLGTLGTDNITTFTSPNGGSGLLSEGQLRDFNTGNPTAVTLTVTGGTFNGPVHAALGADPTTGDAFTIFDGKVSGLGHISYINGVSEVLVLTFTNMDPNKVYDLTFFADRDDYGWDRASLVTLSTGGGVGAARTNISSVATDNPNEPGGVIFSGPGDNSTRLPSNNDNGYVARWNNVGSGPDGQVVLTISFDGTVGEQYKGKYGSAIRLIETGNTPNDIDGDGQADIVWRKTDTGAVAVWLGNGLTAPIVGTTTGVIGGAPLVWTIAGNGDLDGDGKADLVWRKTDTGAVAVWLGNGLTAPVVGTTTGVIGGAPLVWTIAGIGDLDGDGKADLVWRKTDTGAVAVWLGNGLTAPIVGTTTGVIGGAPLVWTIAGIGDLDGDGKDDLVWRKTDTGAVAVWLGNGLTAPIVGTTTGVIGGAPLVWTIAGIGDLDGDGKADLVWRKTDTGAVAVWLGNGLTAPVVGTTTGVIGGAPLVWTIADISDLDGDGKADLVWRKTDTGAVAVWLGNGLTAPVVGTTTGVIGGAPMVWEIQP